MMIPMQAIVALQAVDRAMTDVAEKYPDHVNVARYLVATGHNGFEITKLLREEIPFAYAVAAVKITGGRI